MSETYQRLMDKADAYELLGDSIMAGMCRVEAHKRRTATQRPAGHSQS